ncbi:MAG: UDP-3-O-(3-hydroxymyristoyl)glucosamine N-acyltransferase [Methylococcaceae bacterium]|nr:UDP-3-O-(3-hydroxymyristoyl)glucosamine N-acyltransferase [Methylococcaceae bacterium]
MTLTLQELAVICDATVQGNAASIITGAADIKSAVSQQLTVLSDVRYAKYLSDCAASACIVKEGAVPENAPPHLTLLICSDPEISYIKAVNALHPAKQYPAFISPQTAIAASAQLATTAYIGAFVSIGEDCMVGEASVILNGAVIGNHVKIGRNCCIHPQVVIYDHTEIGDNVTIHAGTVIGADGFGYKNRKDQHIKVPHVGNVIIHDHVEIGANTCIDRGAFGATVIGAGTKIDNNVQIGHNNIIGKNVIICGQTGISGSCTIEDNAILAGSAGIADHVTIGHHAVIMARSGISNDVAPCTQVFGSPAKERKTAWKELAALGKLPELLKTIKVLEQRIQELEYATKN